MSQENPLQAYIEDVSFMEAFSDQTAFYKAVYVIPLKTYTLHTEQLLYRLHLIYDCVKRSINFYRQTHNRNWWLQCDGSKITLVDAMRRALAEGRAILQQNQIAQKELDLFNMAKKLSFCTNADTIVQHLKAMVTDQENALTELEGKIPTD